MKVLYISYDGMTDPLGQSQVIPYLKGLSRKGHQITLISCEKKERFAELNTLISGILEQDAIEWHPVPYSTLPSILSKQVNLSAIERKAEMICRSKQPEIVHCRSYMAALVGLKIKRRHGVRFIFDMRGFWADERIDGNIWSLKNPVQKRLYAYFKKKELSFLKQADHTISLTENAKTEILSWKELENISIPIEVIPCCTDLSLFSQDAITAEKKDLLKKQLHISSSDFVISYLGSIGTWYMLEEMLDFFSCLLLKKPNARFLFITPDNKEHILSAARKKDIPEDRIIIISARRSEVPAYLSLSDLSLYFIRPLYSKKASSPTKTAEIMGMGIPIITNTGIGDSDLILTRSKAGLLAGEFSITEYQRIIEQIDVFLKADKTAIVNASHEYFSLEKGVALYDGVYEQVGRL